MKMLVAKRMTNSIAAAAFMLSSANVLNADEFGVASTPADTGKTEASREVSQRLERSAVRKKAEKRETNAVKTRVNVQRTSQGKHWIGLYCLRVSPALRSQLNLDDGQGLIVERVVEDSSAAKAGIQRYDVLLKAADTELADITDLVEVVEAAGKDQQELELQLLRAGKKLVVKATPTERRDAKTLFDPYLGDRDRIGQYFERLVEPGETKLRYRLIRPGIAIDRSGDIFQKSVDLPDDLSISISRSGKQPAHISVKHGDKTWEINENELDKLPQNLRTHVERHLRRPSITSQRIERLKDFWTPGQPGERIIRRQIQAEKKQSPSLEQRIDAIDRKLEKLQNTIEKLTSQKE